MKLTEEMKETIKLALENDIQTCLNDIDIFVKRDNINLHSEGIEWSLNYLDKLAEAYEEIVKLPISTVFEDGDEELIKKAKKAVEEYIIASNK